VTSGSASAFPRSLSQSFTNNHDTNSNNNSSNNKTSNNHTSNNSNNTNNKTSNNNTMHCESDSDAATDREGRPRGPSGEASIHRFDLSPPKRLTDKSRQGLEGSDEVRYEIEEEFSSLLSPEILAAPVSPKKTVFHRLATPPRQRHSLSGPGVVDDSTGRIRRGRKSHPGSKESSSEVSDPSVAGPNGDSQSFPVEDEFAAWTAAQALQQLGSGRQEAESAWKMCLLREKLKCLQRSKEASAGSGGGGSGGGRFTWAPALHDDAMDAQADSTTDSTVAPVVDRDVWPSWQVQELGEACESSELPLLDEEAVAPPVASDLFFNFAEIEDAEEEQLSFLGSVLQAWADQTQVATKVQQEG